MKFRYHRGSLAESLKTTVEIEQTIAALANHLGVRPESITVRHYGLDERCGWNVHLVMVGTGEGSGVYGMTDALPAY